jgi:predicted transcriptional regulator
MPNPSDDRDRPLSVRLDDDTAATLRAMAASNFRTVSGEVRAAIAEHLTRERTIAATFDRVADRTGEVRA